MSYNEEMEVSQAKLVDEKIDGTADTAAEVPTEAKATSTRTKKLAKVIDGTVVKITVIGGEKGEMVFDSAELPEEVKVNMVPFGLNHKLGDAAAGQSGTEAEEAITKVWEGLLKGEWTIRQPAAPKVSITDVKANLEKLSPEEQQAAKALLASMGITV